MPAEPPSNFPDPPGVIPSALMPPPTTSQATLFDTTPPWHVDLVLGFPAGLRVQHSLFGTPLAVEGFLGLELIVPTAGLGLRWQGTVLQGSSNALMISPGIDAYVGTLESGSWGSSAHWRTFFGCAGDVDLVWRHVLGDGVEGNVGIKLGLVAGGTSHRSGFTLPVLGVCMGWGF
jgi:hypothetical protein